MRTKHQIEADLEWCSRRLHDAQEHSIIVKIEAKIDQLQKELKAPEKDKERT